MGMMIIPLVFAYKGYQIVTLAKDLKGGGEILRQIEMSKV
jgi:hypothetical protein